MKSLARGYIWWPGLDLDLENEVKWIPAVIKQKIGPVSYTIILPDGRLIKRRVDHILSRECSPNYSDHDFDDFQYSVHGSTIPKPSNGSTAEPRRTT